MRVNFFKTLIVAVALVLGVNVSVCHAAPAHDAQAVGFIRDLTDRLINEVVGSELDQETRVSHFRKLFTDAADLDAIGRFVLGRNWRQATKKQKAEFLKAFEDVTVLTWSKRFDEYSGQTIEVVDTRPAKGKNQLFIDSKVKQGNDKPEVPVIWRVREKNGRFYVIDIIVEGASMATTYRSEYTAVIKNKGGIDGLIKTLQDMAIKLAENKE